MALRGGCPHLEPFKLHAGNFMRTKLHSSPSVAQSFSPSSWIEMYIWNNGAVVASFTGFYWFCCVPTSWETKVSILKRMISPAVRWAEQAPVQGLHFSTQLCNYSIDLSKGGRNHMTPFPRCCRNNSHHHPSLFTVGKWRLFVCWLSDMFIMADI